jgi:hypothetical protein
MEKPLQMHQERIALSLPPDFDGNLRPWTRQGSLPDKLLIGADFIIVKLRNDIPGPNPRPIRRISRADLPNHNPLDLFGNPSFPANFGGDRIHPSAYETTGYFSILNQLASNVLQDFAGDGE